MEVTEKKSDTPEAVEKNAAPDATEQKKEPITAEEMELMQQFLDILEQQNMHHPAQDFMEIVQYMVGMQLQLSAMTEELQGVREQLANIQTIREAPDKAITDRTTLSDHIKGLEEKVGKLSEQIGKIKDYLIGTISEAMKAFRDNGKQEMNKVICKGISGVQNLLSITKEKMEEIRLDFEKTSNQIDSIGDELKQLGNSAANVGRLLSGKGTQEVSEEKQGVAFTRAVNLPVKKMLHKLNKGIEQLEQKTEKLEALAKKFEPKEKVSLKERLANMKQKVGAEQSGKSMPQKTKEKAEAL